MDTMHDELDDAMQNPEFAHGAFLHEMWNHEYHINMQGDWDVCSCFGRCEYGEGKGGLTYLREMGYGDAVLEAYQRARDEYCIRLDERSW